MCTMAALYSNNIILCFPADVADKQVRLDMFEFVTGTIEQTAALVTGVLYELAHNQNIQNNLREHLDSELDEHQQQVTIDQLDRLPYLENVLKGRQDNIMWYRDYIRHCKYLIVSARCYYGQRID
jgi:hypothetical protein